MWNNVLLLLHNPSALSLSVKTVISKVNYPELQVDGFWKETVLLIF